MFFGWITKTALACIGLALVSLLGLWGLYLRGSERETKVVFLSVGQGDAILITQGQSQVLIDGGREGRQLLSHLGRHLPFYDRTLEAVVVTHPDADHIGGLPALLHQYRVETWLSTGARSDTATVELLERELERSFRGSTVPAIAGTGMEFPGGGKLFVVFPVTPLPPEASDTNTGSVVARFEFGQSSFLLTGDLPEEELYYPEAKPATVLKVAHHGSRYSTSEAWLDLVRPREAIVSVGENSYGHPAPEVLQRLAQRDIAILRTDERGDIVYRCRVEWNGCRRD